MWVPVTPARRGVRLARSPVSHDRGVPSSTIDDPEDGGHGGSAGDRRGSGVQLPLTEVLLDESAEPPGRRFTPARPRSSWSRCSSRHCAGSAAVHRSEGSLRLSYGVAQSSRPSGWNNRRASATGFISGMHVALTPLVAALLLHTTWRQGVARSGRRHCGAGRARTTAFRRFRRDHHAGLRRELRGALRGARSLDGPRGAVL